MTVTADQREITRYYEMWIRMVLVYLLLFVLARKIPQTWDAQDRSCYHPPKFYFPASGEGGKLRLAPTTYRGPGHAGGHGTHKGAWGSKTREASRIGLKREEGSTWMTRVYTGGRDEAARQPGICRSWRGVVMPRRGHPSPCPGTCLANLFPIGSSHRASPTLLGRPCLVTTPRIP